MNNTFITIVETPHFFNEAKRLLTNGELENIKVLLASKPSVGDVIPGTGGVRKIRYGVRGKGKSGGVRVIYFYYNDEQPLFLLDVYAKADKDNLTKAECNSLAKLVDYLKAKKKG